MERTQLLSRDIVKASAAGVRVAVIAGEALGVVSPVSWACERDVVEPMPDVRQRRAALS
jgi:hypothetical protein